jgi:hypothetical protein
MCAVYNILKRSHLENKQGNSYCELCYYGTEVILFYAKLIVLSVNYLVQIVGYHTVKYKFPNAQI